MTGDRASLVICDGANNRFYSGSIIIDSMNNTMLIGRHWFTSKWINRPRTVVKVLFCQTELGLSKKIWVCQKLELLFESNE